MTLLTDLRIKPPRHMSYPVTPDGRYFVVKGRLWRCTNPALPHVLRKQLVADLMRARRQKAVAKREDDTEKVEAARNAINVAKQKLGERGDVWWKDGAPDLNRFLVKNTPYADWFSKLSGEGTPSVLLYRDDRVEPEALHIVCRWFLAPQRFLDHRRQGMVIGVAPGSFWKHRPVHRRLKD
jgi:hypothetical protein